METTKKSKQTSDNPAVIKTIRIPQKLCDAVEKHALNKGSNFNDTVISALYKLLGLPTDEISAFINRLHEYVTHTWTEDNFPENVTHLVFKHLKNDQILFEEYLRITSNDRSLREILHRKIGKMVKQSLNAKVIGRSLPLTGEDELITTYALLRPSTNASV